MPSCVVYSRLACAVDAYDAVGRERSVVWPGRSNREAEGRPQDSNAVQFHHNARFGTLRFITNGVEIIVNKYLRPGVARETTGALDAIVLKHCQSFPRNKLKYYLQ